MSPGGAAPSGIALWIRCRIYETWHLGGLAERLDLGVGRQGVDEGVESAVEHGGEPGTVSPIRWSVTRFWGKL